LIGTNLRYKDITTDEQLREYCSEIQGSRSIAFDTEFVSERTYRPVLCLVQVSADDSLAVIDAVAIKDLTPFWELVSSGDHETIVHAGRSEMEFCLDSVGCWPKNLFDVQIAAGLAGLEYPAAYSTLTSKLLGLRSPKGETRTNWQRRPLSSRQLEYALDDAEHLPTIRKTLHDKLEELGRLDWLAEEMASWQAEVDHSRSAERWRRLSGSNKLEPRGLAIARELWKWREDEAARRNCPVRHVLRDDLIIELAKRKTDDPKHIRDVRGLDRGDLRRAMDKIAASISVALELPEDQCPKKHRRHRSAKMSVLGQVLFSALGGVCRQQQMAPNLVGTPSDIRQLVAYSTGEHHGRKLPKLASGWREEFVGRLFKDLLSGKTVIRITDPESDCPLSIEPAS
jgi:ribonuclease D